MDQALPTPAQKAVIEFSRRFGCGNGAVRKYGAKLLGWLREGPIDYDYHGLTPGAVRQGFQLTAQDPGAIRLWRRAARPPLGLSAGIGPRFTLNHTGRVNLGQS